MDAMIMEASLRNPYGNVPMILLLCEVTLTLTAAGLQVDGFQAIGLARMAAALGPILSQKDARTTPQPAEIMRTIASEALIAFLVTLQPRVAQALLIHMKQPTLRAIVLETNSTIKVIIRILHPALMALPQIVLQTYAHLLETRQYTQRPQLKG